MLTVENLSTGYGDLKALFNVSLHVDKGEVVSLVGSNGAGKTTFLRTISGLMPVSENAKIEFMGIDLIKMPAHKRAELGIAHIPQGRGILNRMSVRDNLYMGCYNKKSKRNLERNLEQAFKRFPKLKARENQIAGSLSGGEQQMLAIARALMMEPELIMMDEPSLGLAPIIVQEVFEIIQEVAKENVSILIVEQNLRQALSVADRGYVLETGHIALEGTADELLNNPAVQSAYLGI